MTGGTNVGLGPSFNSQFVRWRAMGSRLSGGVLLEFQQINPIPNPQIAIATLNGAQNTMPSFITSNGPVREARFVDSERHGRRRRS